MNNNDYLNLAERCIDLLIFNAAKSEMDEARIIVRPHRVQSRSDAMIAGTGVNR